MNLLVGRRTRCVTHGQHLVINALRQRLHALFLGLRHQPIPIGLHVLILVLLHIRCSIYNLNYLII